MEDNKRRQGQEGGRSDVDDAISDIEASAVAKPTRTASPRPFKRDTPFYNDQKPKEVSLLSTGLKIFRILSIL